MKHMPLVLLAAALSLGAAVITLESPSTGDALRVGDTAYIKFSCDADFMAANNGVLISVSPVKNGWCDMHPANVSDITVNTVYQNNPAWGNVPVVIKDSVRVKIVIPGTIKDSIYFQTVSMVSDSVRFKVREYSGAPSSIGGYCSILPPEQQQPEKKTGACGSGAVLALIPPFWLRRRAFRKRKTKQ